MCWLVEGWTPASGSSTRSEQLELLTCENLDCLLGRSAHALIGPIALPPIRNFTSDMFDFDKLNKFYFALFRAMLASIYYRANFLITEEVLTVSSGESNANPGFLDVLIVAICPVWCKMGN